MPRSPQAVPRDVASKWILHATTAMALPASQRAIVRRRAMTLISCNRCRFAVSLEVRLVTSMPKSLPHFPIDHCVRRTFFEHLRALLQYLPFDNWAQLTSFMLARLTDIEPQTG